MTTTTNTEASRAMLDAFTDALAWLSGHQPLIAVWDIRNRATVLTGGKVIIEAEIKASLADLPAIVAELPTAGITIRARESWVFVEITAATPAGTPMVLSTYLREDEAAALAHTAGLNFPTRPDQLPVTTDTLAAASERTGDA